MARTIRRLHQQLTAAPSLRPGDGADRLFRRLVRAVVTTPPGPGTAVLADPEILALRQQLVELCARGEYQLELAWSRHVTASLVPALALARFPYLDNYRQLTRLEHAALEAHNDRLSRCALFVGAGPLPLSSLLLTQHLGVPVDNLDIDRTAVRAARALVDRLGATARLRFEHGDLAACDDLARYDLVVLASLVGLTSDQKADHLRHLLDTMAPGALLLARSAHGLRTLLYPEVHLSDLEGFAVLAVIHPEGPVINSTILARKPESPAP